jgi:hypothetical protein
LQYEPESHVVVIFTVTFVHSPQSASVRNVGHLQLLVGQETLRGWRPGVYMSLYIAASIGKAKFLARPPMALASINAITENA